MSQRLLLAGIVCLALGSCVLADSLDAQLFPLTGEIRYHNPNAFAVPFVYSSITSLTRIAERSIRPNGDRFPITTT